MKYFAVSMLIISLSFMVVALFLPDSFDRDKNLRKVEQGMMSKVRYQNHTYVVWSINFGGGIIHDPDCECMKKGDK